MIYRILILITDEIALFRYITFRAAMAAVTALLFSFVLGRPIIRFIKSINLTETIRNDGPAGHINKTGTPTMGGLLIICSILSGVVFWADLSNPFIRILILITAILGILGITDDLLKRRDKNGIKPAIKIIVQVIVGLILGLFVLNYNAYGITDTMTNIIFLKNIMINLSFMYIPFVILVLTGTTNAVNLSDGLDGLSAGMLAIIFTVFTAIAYISGNSVFSEYLNMHFIAGSGETTVFLASSAAASLGFLWFNSHPAEIFMGDTGSLTLGGILAASAILLKQEILLLIAGGMFVVEAMSVIIQVTSFKLTGRRVFPMAPLHHSFEKMGMPENKIVVRFWIVSILFGILALSTLKLR